MSDTGQWCTMSLNEPLAYFRANRDKFVRGHHREFVLIHDNSEIGFYETGGKAYKEARNRNLESGTFLIRQCLREDEENVAIFHSRVS